MSLSGLLSLIDEIPGYAWLREQILGGIPAAADRCLPLTLPEAVIPFLISCLQRDAVAPLLVVTANLERAKRLADQLALWSAFPAQVLLYPEPEALPYERPSADLGSCRERLAALVRIGALTGLGPANGIDFARLVAVTSVRGLAHKTISPRDLAAGTHELSLGQRVDPAALVAQLLEGGYQPSSLVDTPGFFSRRGGILDIFPPTSELPARVEFFGDQVESLRLYDPATQRSQKRLSRLLITPASEVVPARAREAASRLSKLDITGCSPRFQENWSRDLKRLAQGQGFAGEGFYLPFLYPPDRSTGLLDHLSGTVILDGPEGLEAEARYLHKQAQDLRALFLEHGELPPEYPDPCFRWEELQAQLQRLPRLALGYWGRAQTARPETDLLASAFQAVPPYAGRLKQFLDDCQKHLAEGRRLVITSHQARRLSALFQERDIFAVPQESPAGLPPPNSLTVIQGSLAQGWGALPPASTTLIFSDVEIFGWAKPRRALPRRAAPREPFLSDLALGDLVVHVEHGIGRYRGLVRLALEGAEREYLHLEYAQGDRLYVPADQMDRISRYVGAGEAPPTLTRLSGTDWERVKARAKRAIKDVARKLLGLYAAREAAAGYAFAPDFPWQADLEASFPYIETPDQLAAINEVKLDMEAPRPMDRLICGDVGYGKTEIALRAAFKAVVDGKQVALLVPTTILAQQHFNTFRERLQAFPVTVEMLSRFRSEKEQQEVVKGLREGSVDIVIGTHRLIQKDVAFKNLGLVIIDEEQRFGVMHKETLKELRREVDVLTLTATPIPRTLHMSLVGVRDMSTMETPPEERLPIVTQVAEYDGAIIRGAILRELDRGGQVYFVHNRVQSIEYMGQVLARLVPEARIAVAHGQMPEEDLEKVMLDFAGGLTDVLVCTAIIESGLDIPNANTIIVNRADHFGLAQLYQLRGRVGRGANRAYAYFLHSRGSQLSEAARKRLQAIYDATELGAGFRIAMKDLEIRGAGNLLGVEQHGHISAVGFDLYCRLLAQAVEELREETGAASLLVKGAPTLVEPPSVSLDLGLDAYIPSDYVPDEAARLTLYQRLAGARSPEEVNSLAQELADRFGAVPGTVENLLYLVRLRALVLSRGIRVISLHGSDVVMRFREAVGIDMAKAQRRFGASLKVGPTSMRLSRRGLGARWKEALVELLGMA